MYTRYSMRFAIERMEDTMKQIELKALAKINLGLDVLEEERTDIMMCVWSCRPFICMMK